jgi:hypothetical protein
VFESGVEFNIIKMFNNAQKIKYNWDEDLVPLIADDISFQELMKSLAVHLKLKEAKKLLKDAKQK